MNKVRGFFKKIESFFSNIYLIRFRGWFKSLNSDVKLAVYIINFIVVLCMIIFVNNRLMNEEVTRRVAVIEKNHQIELNRIKSQCELTIRTIKRGVKS